MVGGIAFASFALDRMNAGSSRTLTDVCVPLGDLMSEHTFNNALSDRISLQLL